MSTTLRVSTGYRPRHLQAVLHQSLRRFNVLVMHRRFGKTVFAINELIDRSLRNSRRNPQYAYLAPTYGQAKRVAWQYLKDFTAAIPGVEINEAELRVDIPRPGKGDRIRIMLLGAENPASLKGIYLDGVVLDEFGEMFPSAWSEAIRPTLSDRKGWAIFIGTPKGQNHFYDLYNHAMTSGDPEFFFAMYRASETGIIDASELESARRVMSEEEYNQDYECSFAAGLVGAYWGKEMEAAEREGRLTSVPYDPALTVETFWDLGMNDVTAIWFMQRHFAQWRAIDYMQAPDTGLPEWVNKLRATRYTLGPLYLPHDAKVRELGTGRSRYEVVRGLVGARLVKVIPRVEDKLDSIEAGRRMIARTVFDATKCKDGIKALKNYQRKYDTKLAAFSPKPLHNFASNGADAWQGFAMGAVEDRGEDDNRERQRDYAEEKQDFFTFSGRFA